MSRKTHPLRIALVASSLVQAGAEKQFVYMARAFRKMGVDIHVYHLGSGGHYESVLRTSGIPVHGVGCPGKPLRILFRLVRALRAFQPQIVIASQFGDVIHAALAGRLVGAFVACGVRNNGFLHAHGRRTGMMLRLPHVLITNSECARQNLVSQGVAPSKIEVISNVIDLQDFDRRSSRSVSIPVDSGQTVAVAVGRIDRNKRFDRLVRALALTRSAAPALAGLIVGRDLGQQSSLQAYAMTLDVDNLAFAGPSNHVPAILARSHMLIVTSDGEGFPNVLLEAMAGRLPVITTPAGDASAIVTRAKAGYVVDFDNATRMAERMVHLAQHPEVRGHLGCNGRQAVEEKYNFEALPGRLLTTYKQATAEWKFPWPDRRPDTAGSTIDVETPDLACSECLRGSH